jgi:hypothetical protein
MHQHPCAFTLTDAAASAAFSEVAVRPEQVGVRPHVSGKWFMGPAPISRDADQAPMRVYACGYIIVAENL